MRRLSGGTNYCPYCGERVDAGTRYCPKCGTRIPMIGAAGAQTIDEPSYQKQQAYGQRTERAYEYQPPYTEPRYRKSEMSSAAFILSVIGGIIILINGLLVALVGAFFVLFGVGILLIVLGLVFGLVVLYAAFKLNSNPSEHVTWGVVIIVFSILSIVIGGGFFVGMILGLIGGVLALVQER